MASLEVQARDLGIPMEIEIDDGTRYDYCDAHMGTLASIEGTTAVYKGQCSNRHVYQMRVEIEELRRRYSIVDGELVMGEEKGYKANDLEEY